MQRELMHQMNASHSVAILDIAPVSSNEFFDNQTTTGCGFTLKRVRDMIRTHIQSHISLKKSTWNA